MVKYILYCFFIALVMAIASCNTKSKKLNERVSLWRNDKIPYGTYYAYENISRIFPDADIVVSKKSPDKYRGLSFGESAENYRESNQRSAYIIISPQMQPDTKEIKALFDFVGEGNHLFIAAFTISSELLDSLRLETALYSGYFNAEDSLTIDITHPVTYDSLRFSYPGKALDNYFVSIDSSFTTIAGKNEEGNANFVRVGYENGGSISIHLAPIAFTNFFLLHGDNKAYFDNALSYLPQDIKMVKWDDYFRSKAAGKKGGFSKLSAFLNNEILRWAFWLVVLLFAIIYLFESKRKQNIVPVIPPVKNASLDFVKTIGRLYHQRKDNRNLAIKMSSHFLDNVRSRYNISTSVLSEEFENKLAHKSDYDPGVIREIIYAIKTFPDRPSISDAELLNFNDKLEKFIKHH